MSTATVLVMAKAPVPGAVKTRLGATVGAGVAARLAHAALLDTLAVCESVAPPGRRVVALAGAVAESVEPAELDRALSAWDVVAQDGATFAERLRAAHLRVHATHGGPVVQLGMDTPHLTPGQLGDVIAASGEGRPVLGRAHDGGWWVMATTAPHDVTHLGEVPMSRTDTWVRTLDCLERAAGTVLSAAELADVDTAVDAESAAAAAPRTRFALAWRQLSVPAVGRTS